MLKVGHWIGQYKYDKKAHQRLTGFDFTNFEIEIIVVDKNTFSGQVQDDLTTGGTKGIGKVQGKIVDNKVEFVKRMPFMSLIDKDGSRKTLKKEHHQIYYSGTFSNDKKSISGQWRFKFGVIWFGLMPIPTFPIRGTWTMKLKE